MLRIAFAGTPEFALPALDALAASRHHLVGVLTQPDQPARRWRALRPGTTSAALHVQLAQLGAPLLLDVIEALEAGRAQPRAQPLEGVSYAPKIDRQEAQIEWTMPAERIARQVCGCNPWPVAQTLLEGKQLRIWTARAQHQSAARHEPPGTVLGLEQGRLLVACGVGVLAIETLQSAGRRVLSAGDFAHGHDLAGLMLG